MIIDISLPKYFQFVVYLYAFFRVLTQALDLSLIDKAALSVYLQQHCYQVVMVDFAFIFVLLYL